MRMLQDEMQSGELTEMFGVGSVTSVIADTSNFDVGGSADAFSPVGFQTQSLLGFPQAPSVSELIASYLLSGGGDYRKVILSCESEKLTLPVTPWRYDVTTSQNNKIVDILDFGEALLFGNAKLKQLKFTCFFPNQDRHKDHKYVVGDKFSSS